MRGRGEWRDEKTCGVRDRRVYDRYSRSSRNGRLCSCPDVPLHHIPNPFDDEHGVESMRFNTYRYRGFRLN